MNTLPQKYVKSLFDYRDGNLYWKVAKGRRVKVGDLAGTVSMGYRRVKIDGKIYAVHRLIFILHHGSILKYLDHIDGNPLNNSIGNLRDATSQENNRNRKKIKSYGGKSPTSRFKGVSWYEQYEKWQVRIGINGKRKHLGYFTLEIDAAKAYDKVAIDVFGEFAKLNSDPLVSI